MKVLYVVVALALPVMAQAETPMREISVTASGEVAATPDMATVQAGVMHQSREAADAMAQASDGASAVLARLRDAGIAPRDIQTGAVQLNAVWSNYNNSGQAPEITGFVARISMSVRVRELDRLGNILDLVVRDGANELGGVRYGFAEPEPLMDKARRRAVAAGQARALLLSEAAGVTLGKLVSLREGGAEPRPVAMETRALSADSGVPVAPGELRLTASVSMVYRIAD